MYSGQSLSSLPYLLLTFAIPDIFFKLDPAIKIRSPFLTSFLNRDVFSASLLLQFSSSFCISSKICSAFSPLNSLFDIQNPRDTISLSKQYFRICFETFFEISPSDIFHI